MKPEAPPCQRRAISDLKAECPSDEEPAPVVDDEEHRPLMDEETDLLGPQLEDDLDFLQAIEDAIQEEELLEMQRLADQEHEQQDENDKTELSEDQPADDE